MSRDIEALSALRASMTDAIADEITVRLNIDAAKRGATPHELKGFLLRDVYEDWTLAAASHDAVLSGVLASLWASSKRHLDARAKSKLYRIALANPSAPLAEKREAFANLVRAGMVGTYAKNKQNELVRSGNEKMESILYGLVPKFAERAWVNNRHKTAETDRREEIPESASEKLIALALDSPDFDIDSFLKSHAKLCRNYLHGWQIDPSWPYDLIFHEGSDFHPVYRHAMFNFLVMRKHGITYAGYRDHIPDQYRSAGGKLMENEDFKAVVFAETRRMHGKSLPDSRWQDFLKDELGIPSCKEYCALVYASGRELGWVMSHFTRLPAPAEAENLLRVFEKFQSMHAWAGDKTSAAVFKTPHFMQGRDPLTTFLMTRFWSNIDTGQQQSILKAMEGVTPETVLRIFLERTGLEKIGQFLSYWPEVPRAIRQELAPLQDKVAPSDIDEVRRTILKELPASLERDSILANLDPNPIGSGSIGECYRSRLANGEEVVVKVIPPTKEKKFVDAMKMAREVRKILNAYLEVSPEEIPHAREASRIIGMLLDIFQDEFDLQREAANADEMRGRLTGGIRIPEYKRGLVAKKTAVIEFARGKKPSDVSPQSRTKAGANLSNFFFAAQTMGSGIYHSDLQPGNVLIDDETGDAWILDFGQMGRLEERNRGLLPRLAGAGLQKDLGALISVLEEIAEKKADYDKKGLEDDIRGILSRLEGGQNHVSDIATETLGACRRRNLPISPPFLHLMKGVAAFEATMADLNGGDIAGISQSINPVAPAMMMAGAPMAVIPIMR